MSKIYKGALIGCGYVSKIQLEAWSRIQGAEIVCLSSRNRGKAEKRAAEFRIEGVYTDYVAMMDSGLLDFVDIATQPPPHVEIVSEAAKRGLQVLCQKPAAGTLAELRQMIRVCSDAGVALMVNENCRFQPWFRKMKELMDGGAIGRPFYASMYSRWRGSCMETKFAGQPYFAEMPRLVIYELGVHYLDTLRYLFGEPMSVYAQSQRINQEIAGEELGVVLLRIGDLHAVVDMSWASVPSYDIEGGGSWGAFKIEGEKGTLYSRKDGLLRQISDDGEEQFQFPPDAVMSGYQAAQQHFIDCLRSGVEPETSGRQTLKTMELVFGAYHSAAVNRPYRVGVDLDCLS